MIQQLLINFASSHSIVPLIVHVPIVPLGIATEEIEMREVDVCKMAALNLDESLS